MSALPVMPLEAVKMRGTIDVALRIKNYLQSMMREAKRLRLITANPNYDLDGSIKTHRVIMTWLIRLLEENREELLTPHELANQVGENVMRLRSAKRTE